jgi:indolepyruvate ferredoxin oxidoreductase alpha subunit
MSKALGERGKGKIVGVIGDSTFIHSGITPLLDMAYNRSNAVIVICDNRTTAMTGMQEHPATGFTLQGEKAMGIDLAELARVLGIESVRIVDPHDLKTVRKVLKEELDREGPSVVISRRSCALFKREVPKPRKPLSVDEDKCTGCRLCLGLGCPPITWNSQKAALARKDQKARKKREGFAVIDRSLCTGCGLCRQLCRSGAIGEGI